MPMGVPVHRAFSPALSRRYWRPPVGTNSARLRSRQIPVTRQLHCVEACSTYHTEEYKDRAGPSQTGLVKNEKWRGVWSGTFGYQGVKGCARHMHTYGGHHRFRMHPYRKYSRYDVATLSHTDCCRVCLKACSDEKTFLCWLKRKR